MRVIGNSQLAVEINRNQFWWSTGIEDTFIIAPFAKTGRVLDEYELTRHYENWQTDLDMIAELGVETARYGIPWYKVNPGKNVWDFEWLDRVIDRFMELGIDPIVDLVHYGTPAWLERALLDPDFPEYMALFAATIAKRYRGKLHWFTPLNEPRIASWYTGKLGWWPPFRRSWSGFVKIMANICKGIVLTCKAIKSELPDSVMVHVDATDLYSTQHDELRAECEFRTHLVFLALDFITGTIGSRHPLFSWLQRMGVTDEEFCWFEENAVPIDILGINMYPMFTNKVLIPGSNGIRTRMIYADASMVYDLCESYWERYQRPVMITEIASLGSIRRRKQWLVDSTRAVNDARTAGIPVIGYTYWPLYSLIAWSYRQGKHPVEKYVLKMGLWDLGPQFERIRTELVDIYRQIVLSPDSVSRYTGTEV